jgi:ABC-2 type transport system permease protein
VDQAPFGPLDLLGADRDRRARHRPGAAISAAAAHGYARSSVSGRQSRDPAAASLAALGIAVLGVLCISSEYSSGMIRAGLTAVPKRGRVLAAKSPVLAAVTFVVGEATSFTALFAGQALISAAIAVMVAVLFVPPAIAQALPDSWRNPVTEFWPTQAGSQLTSVHHSAHTLQPWPGFGVMCLFTAIVYAIAWTLLDHRDA